MIYASVAITYYINSVSDQNRPPALLWQRKGLNFGSDVTWTPAGNIAVVDFGAESVKMWNMEGNEIANTSNAGFQFRRPRVITFHDTWHGGVIVVAEQYTCRLVALHPGDLHLVDTINLKTHCVKLNGVTVLDADIIVAGIIKTSGATSSGSGAIVVSTAGVVQQKWRLETVATPWYLSTTVDDHLLIPVSAGNTVYKTTVSGKVVWQTEGSSITPSPGAVVQDHSTSHIK